MKSDETIFREASNADIPAMFDVRTSVIENPMSIETLLQRGITPTSVAAALAADREGWVAQRRGNVVAFVIADRSNGSIFALFVRPECEGQGIGGELLTLATQWLWNNFDGDLRLTTGPNTRAAGFYARKGWTSAGMQPDGELRFELGRPPSAS